MTTRQTFYIICATPRSGSSLLCEALQNTGLAGKPEEYFLPANQQRWQEQWCTPLLEEYIQEMVKQSSTANGVFGVKIMWRNFETLLNTLRQKTALQPLPDKELINTLFPAVNYIWITRRDKIRQAVSHAMARQTNVWAVKHGDTPSPVRKPQFSFEQIDLLVHEIEAHEKAWQQYFVRNEIQPLTIYYEDFVAAYQTTTVHIVKYLNIAIPDAMTFMPCSLKKQADEESERWVQCYLQLKQQKVYYRLLSSANRVLVKLPLHTVPSSVALATTKILSRTDSD